MKARENTQELKLSYGPHETSVSFADCSETLQEYVLFLHPAEPLNAARLLHKFSDVWKRYQQRGLPSWKFSPDAKHILQCILIFDYKSRKCSETKHLYDRGFTNDEEPRRLLSIEHIVLRHTLQNAMMPVSTTGKASRSVQKDALFVKTCVLGDSTQSQALLECSTAKVQGPQQVLGCNYNLTDEHAP